MASDWQVRVKNQGGQVRRYGPCVIDVTVIAHEVPADVMKSKPFQWYDWSIEKARALAQAATSKWYTDDEEAPHWYVYTEKHMFKDNDSRSVRFVAHRPYAD